MCFSEEETRQWQGPEGESEAWNSWENIGEAKKKKKQGQEGEPRGVFGCQCSSGIFELWQQRSYRDAISRRGQLRCEQVTFLSADCERKQESTENIRSSNRLPSRAHFLLISPDSRLDRRADICRQNSAHVDLLVSAPGLRWRTFSEESSAAFSLPVGSSSPLFFLGHGKKILLVFGMRCDPMTQSLRAGRGKQAASCRFLHFFWGFL